MILEEREHLIRALLHEREGYEREGKADRVEAVNAELRRLGVHAERPQGRAERRPSSRRAVESR